MARKIELTPALVELHRRLRSEGVPIARACQIAGHAVSVWYRWVAEAEEWKQIERARALGLFDGLPPLAEALRREAADGDRSAEPGK